MDEEAANEFVNRKAPMEVLNRVLQCDDGFKSFYTVTGAATSHRHATLTLYQPLRTN